MGDLAIRVESLSKRYRIGRAETKHDTFVGTMLAWAKTPLENFRRLRRLSHFEAEEADDIIWALKDVSFEVEHGEVIGIIGHNGAGKSTLLKILSRITDPTGGRAIINGRVSSLLEVGTGFHPELTGRENVYLNGTVLGMTKAEVDLKFDEIVDFSGVEKYIDTPVKWYSSGMKVRLAFSVAAHLEPEVLMIDEVLAVGDVAFQKKCLGKMDDVARGGRTVLFVSHNMGMVRSLCDRSILLENGFITMDGETSTALTHYLAQGGEGGLGGGEVVWSEEQAPGRDEFRLRAVRLTDQAGVVRDTFQADQAIQVEIEYEVKQPMRGMRFVLTLMTQEGEVAFASTDHLGHEEHDLGLSRALCTIPPALLNRRVYRLKLHAGIPGVKQLLKPMEVLSFDVIGAAQHGSYYPEQWPGVVAPSLMWSTEALSRTSQRLVL